MITNLKMMTIHIQSFRIKIYSRQETVYENIPNGPPSVFISLEALISSFYAYLGSCSMQYEGLSSGFTPPQSPRKPASIL